MSFCRLWRVPFLQWGVETERRSDMKDQISVVTIGYEFRIKGWDGKLRPYRVDGGPCGEDVRGAWACTTHKEIFSNNMSKDFHVMTGVHKLAWFCNAHGPEVP